jgi:hypothetical protein
MDKQLAEHQHPWMTERASLATLANQRLLSREDARRK